MSDIRPTVFIGVGGSGCKTVSVIRDLIMRSEANPVFRQVVSFLKIDSRGEPDRNVRDVERDYVGLASEMFGSDMVSALGTRSQQNENIRNSFLASWRKNEDNSLAAREMSFIDGAGGIRENGRLVFAFHEASSAVDQAEKVKSKLIAIRNGFETNAFDLAEQMGDGTTAADVASNADIVIIAGLSGGTGSALALDLAYLARSVFGKPRRLVLFGFLDDVVSATSKKIPPSLVELMRQNAIHTVAELDYWMQPYGRKGGARESYSMYWNADAPAVTTFNPTLPPFDAVYLIGANMEGNTKFADQQMYYDSVARYIGQYYGTDVAAEYMSQQINHACGVFEKAEKSRDKQFASIRFGRIGMHRVALPADAIVEYMTYTNVGEALEQAFNHRHSEQKAEIQVKGTSVKDAKGRQVYVGAIEDARDLTLSETGVAGWSQAVLTEYTKDDGTILAFKEALKVDDKDIRAAGTHSVFNDRITAKIKALDEGYNKVSGARGGAEKGETFDKAIQDRLHSFCDWTHRGQISIRNMRKFLDLVYADCSEALHQAEADASVTLSEIERKSQPGAICSSKWLELQKNLFAPSLLKFFSSVEERGRSAKDAAIGWLKEMSQLKFVYATQRARQDWLRKCVNCITDWTACLADIEKVGAVLQSQCATNVAQAEEAMKSRPGVQTNILDSKNALKAFRPEWFANIAEAPAAKKELFELFQRGVSGCTQGVDGFNAEPGQGLWRYLTQMREKKRLSSGVTGEDASRIQMEQWSEELMAIMTSLARFRWKNKVAAISVWDVIMSNVRQSGKIDVSTSDGVEDLRDRVTKIVKSYTANLRLFGQTPGAAGLSPSPVVSSTVVYSRARAETVIKKEFNPNAKSLFSVSGFLDGVWGGWNTIEGSSPHELLILQSMLAYPASAFKGLEELESYFIAPVGRADDYCWSDVRYPQWFRDRTALIALDAKKDQAEPPQANWARCCLAWAWGDVCGLEYALKNNKHTFSFGSENWIDFDAFFNQFPTSKSWNTLLERMQKIWNGVSPAARSAKLQEVVEFLAVKQGKKVKKAAAGKTGRIMACAREPDRVKWINAADRVIRAEALKAEEAAKTPSVCQNLASMFKESAQEVAEQK